MVGSSLSSPLFAVQVVVSASTACGATQRHDEHRVLRHLSWTTPGPVTRDGQ